MFLLVLVFETEVWLLSVVVLVAIDGLRSSLWNRGARESLLPVSGRKEGDSCRLGGPSLKKLLEVRPWLDSGGQLSSIHGAMAALGASVDGGRFETEGMFPVFAS